MPRTEMDEFTLAKSMRTVATVNGYRIKRSTVDPYFAQIVGRKLTIEIDYDYPRPGDLAMLVRQIAKILPKP